MKQIKFIINENGESTMEIDDNVTCKEIEEIAENFYSAVLTAKMISTIQKNKEEKNA